MNETIPCYLIPAESYECPEKWACSSFVNAGPIPVLSGPYANFYVVTADFLSPEVVAGSPDNEVLRGLLESFEIREVELSDLTINEELEQ
jgi:hypothetical protein